VLVLGQVGIVRLRRYGGNRCQTEQSEKDMSYSVLEHHNSCIEMVSVAKLIKYF
jgi:hypothetical protein